jgi:hypothetical protein
MGFLLYEKKTQISSINKVDQTNPSDQAFKKKSPPYSPNSGY